MRCRATSSQRAGLLRASRRAQSSAATPAWAPNGRAFRSREGSPPSMPCSQCLESHGQSPSRRNPAQPASCGCSPSVANRAAHSLFSPTLARPRRRSLRLLARPRAQGCPRQADDPTRACRPSPRRDLARPSRRASAAASPSALSHPRAVQVGAALLRTRARTSSAIPSTPPPRATTTSTSLPRRRPHLVAVFQAVLARRQASSSARRWTSPLRPRAPTRTSSTATSSTASPSCRRRIPPGFAHASSSFTRCAPSSSSPASPTSSCTRSGTTPSGDEYGCSRWPSATADRASSSSSTRRSRPPPSTWLTPFLNRHIISNHFLLSTLGGLSLFVVLFGTVHTLWRSTISPGDGAGEEHLAKWTFALWPVAYAVAWLLRCVAPISSFCSSERSRTDLLSSRRNSFATFQSYLQVEGGATRVFGRSWMAMPAWLENLLFIGGGLATVATHTVRLPLSLSLSLRRP